MLATLSFHFREPEESREIRGFGLSEQAIAQHIDRLSLHDTREPEALGAVLPRISDHCGWISPSRSSRALMR